MSAICGVLPFSNHNEHGESCRFMLMAQAAYGRHHQAMHAITEVALGRALYCLLPEDRYDAQPLLGGDGRFLLVADVRIDNRDQILAQLGIDRSRSRELSDAAVMLAAFERWHEHAFGRLAGAFAAALWDRERRSLILARDATGQRPLHYHANDRWFAFASTPSGLHALPDLPRLPDEERLAEFVSGIPSDPERTFFKEIRSVLNGHYVVIAGDGGVRSERYWKPSLEMLRLPRADDYVDAYREQLDRAVRAQLRGVDDLVAAHLSSGFDSSAVAATAARLLAPQGGRVLAITAAPREGYRGAVPRGRIADESPAAAEVAALHPNMEHLVVRSGGERVLAFLDREEAIAGEPLFQVCNNLWWRSISEAARARGAHILLTGQAGNMTISAGNIYQLSELVASGRGLRWLAEARALVAGGTVRWRGVLAASFGPWVPRAAWQPLQTAFLGASDRLGPGFLLGRHWREKFARRSASDVADHRLPKNLRAARLLAMQSVGPGTYGKRALAMWGIDERDPTADRQLVEFCLSLPPEMLLSGGVTRALASRALADRLPNSVLHNPLRGMQLADWHELVDGADATRVIAGAQDSETVRRVVDLDRLRELIAHWPTEGWERPSVIGEYRQSVLKALSVVHFLKSADGSVAEPCAQIG